MAEGVRFPVRRSTDPGESFVSSHISRRRFVVAGSAATAAGILVPNSVLQNATAGGFVGLRSGSFPYGVASGEPTTTDITLITTIVDPEGTGGVQVELSKSAGFATVVKTAIIPITDANIYVVGGQARYSVKTKITGLSPYTQYYYRFATSTSNSRVGRFRTALPATSTQAVKYGFFSCQDYTFGYFNAHKAMATEDFDFVINLGDYIYAESYHGASGASPTGVRDDGIGEDVVYGSSTYKVAKTLDDYRAKYDLYRSDPNLQEMHANFAMYSTWDDHEVMDNYAGGAGANGGLPAERDYATRKVNGYKAFFEKMPTAKITTPLSGQAAIASGESRIYRNVRYGKHVEIFLLDQRQYRQDQPCNDPGLLDPAKCSDLDASRKFLGTAQLAWFKSKLKASTATWKVIANEVMIMNTKFTSTQYYNFDSWQGYQKERVEVVKYIRDNAIKNVVFCTGDIHLFAAGDVVVDPKKVKGKALTGGATTYTTSDGKPVATEFVAGSITSQGLGDGGLTGSVAESTALYPKTSTGTYGILFSANPWLANGDTDHHGYARATASSTGFTCDLRRIKTIKADGGTNSSFLSQNDATKKTNGFRPKFSWTVAPGKPGLT